MTISTNDIREIIYGKDPTPGIVAVEVKDSEVYLYKQDGSLETRPYRNWMILNESPGVINKSFIKLKGDLHFKYLTQYDNTRAFFDLFNYCKNNEIDRFQHFHAPEAAMVRHGFTLFKELNIKDVSVLATDIEASNLEMNADSRVLIIANTLRLPNGEIIKRMFSLDDHNSQQDMITEWCDWVRETDPTVLCGHNFFGYDLPYLAHCSLGGLKLGRDGSNIKFNDYVSRFRKDGSQTYEYYEAKIFGRHIIDTMFLAMKYDQVLRKYVSYGLKQIIDQEGLQKEDRTFYDASKIAQNWHLPEERAKIKAYAADDGDDALALYDLMIPSYFYYTQSIPRTFQQIINTATGAQINSFLVRSYVQYGYSIPTRDSVSKYEGAISIGNPGIYDHVMKVDVKSMYPSIILVWKVCNEDKDPHQNFLKMVQYFTEERLKNKQIAKETGDKFYSDIEQAQKIVINSAYGMFGANGLSFNSPKHAEFVTKKGREILKTGMNWVEENGYKIVNVDTDSFSYTKGREISSEEFAEDIKQINALYPEGIEWEDDGMYRKVIVFKAKNYVLWDGKKLTYKGSAMKDQKKEPALKEMLLKFVDAILEDRIDDIRNIYESYIQEAHNIQDISRWASKMTITQAVLKGEGTRQLKVREAIKDLHVQEGDKIWIYPSIDGQKLKHLKGEPQFYKKTGLPMLEPNRVVKVVENWDGDIDVDHLMKRVYDTAVIFENVLDPGLFKNFSLKCNKTDLKGLLR